MSNLTPEELAAQASEQGTFSFIERLRGRNYAKDEVDIYLDEDLGYKLVRLREAYESDSINAQLKLEIMDQITSVLEALEPSRYTFFIDGISNKHYDSLIEDAAEQFPYEYEEVSDPWSGRKNKLVIPSDERNEYFTNLLWVNSIQRVENNGNVDDNITAEFVKAFREEGPLDGIKRVSATIDKLRMATEWIDYTEDEDFFPKP